MEVEWLILADAAQISDGKLFLMGGGWDSLWVNSNFPVQKHFAVAAAFKVPWNETNRRHPVGVEIQDQDGAILFQMGGELEVGRPAGIEPGQDQRAQIAVDLSFSFQLPGTYLIVAKIEGVEKRVPFRVLPSPALAARNWPMRPGQPG